VGGIVIKAWMMKPQAGGLPLTGWSYRKSVTLSRASGAVTDYQMKLLVGESSGATGEDVDCGGLCATDFDDIRFTKSDGTTVLDYWIESVSGATPNQLATIWIEFDSIGTGATTFYMYYGNSGAAVYSNGANTFPFFDNFDDASIDETKWFHWIDNGSEAESGGIFSLVGHASYNAWGAKTKFGTNYAYRGFVKISAETTGGDVNIFSVDDRCDDGTAVGTGVDQAGIRVSDSKYFVTVREGAYIIFNS
jgi:hypothetical protein